MFLQKTISYNSLYFSYVDIEHILEKLTLRLVHLNINIDKRIKILFIIQLCPSVW